MASYLEGMRAKQREDKRRSRLFWLRFSLIAILTIAILLAAFGELPDVGEYLP